MGVIEVPCPNMECDSDDISLTSCTEMRSGSFKHRFSCNYCDTSFTITTKLSDVKIPQEVS